MEHFLGEDLQDHQPRCDDYVGDPRLVQARNQPRRHHLATPYAQMETVASQSTVGLLGIGGWTMTNDPTTVGELAFYAMYVVIGLITGVVSARIFVYDEPNDMPMAVFFTALVAFIWPAMWAAGGLAAVCIAIADGLNKINEGVSMRRRKR